MGVLNVTSDSFSDGGWYRDPETAVIHARDLVAAGADIVDVGGESTRPGSEPVPESEELARVLPVVAALAADGINLSIDTSKPAVASAALEAGAVVVNDVTGLRDRRMRDIAATQEAGVVIMHMQGEPRSMQADPTYEDVVAEVTGFLVDQAAVAEAAGIRRDRIAIDPGIGFGKTIDHNLSLLRNLRVLVETGYPVVLGTSRKGFLGRILGGDVSPHERDAATGATVALAIEQGVAVVRVHNVAMTTHIARTVEAITGRTG
jgi:dihydropteroate synthase